MTEPDFDVIVIGAGVAGCVTAYQLATAGHSVVLIERGETPGSKNLSGGILYCSVMKEIFPDFLETAPVERIISRNQMWFLNEDSHFAIDYADEALHTNGTAVTVLRAKLDAWLAEQCEAAGVMVMPGVRVDGLLREGEQVVGVVAGEDELRSRVVVAADGVNSFIARDAGLRAKPATHQQAVGVKAVIKLPESEINARFGVDSEHGSALSIVGDASKGIGGGGFLYTNKDTLSMGVVMRLDDLVAKKQESVAVFEYYLNHPQLAPLLEGGELIEYGCHLVNEGGEEMMGKLVFDGLVIVGDAAGLTINTGLTMRGMDLAAGSGRAAAAGIDAAIKAGDVSAAGLSRYTKALSESYVGKDMHTFAKAPAFLENERMYKEYGELLVDVFRKIYLVNTTGAQKLLPAARAALKDSPVKLTQLAGDGLKAVKAL